MISKICEYCNKEYFVYPCLYKERKFCSKECTYKGVGKFISVKKIGRNNPAWKGGEITVCKYIKVHSPKHPHSDGKGYVFKHRLVMEEHLKRYLLPEEVVHHIDEDKKNNKISNLMLFHNTGAHTAHHHAIRRKARNAKSKN